MSRIFFLLALLWIVLGTQTACSKSFAGRTVDQVFHSDPVVEMISSAQRGDVQAVRRAIAAGVDVDTRGEMNLTPALWLMGIKDYGALKVLLTCGADPDLAAEEGISLVQIAAADRPREILQMVLDFGANPNVFDSETEQTPLMSAIMEHRLDNADLLIEKGADVNAHSTYGQSAATTAVIFGEFDYALKLLQHGYNYDLADLLKTAEVVVTNVEKTPARQRLMEELERRLSGANAK